MRKITLSLTTADIGCTATATRRNKFSSGFKFLGILLLVLLVSGKSWGATPYAMSGGDYSESFADIVNWTNNFAAGTGSSCWSSVAVNATGSIPDGKKTTKSSSTWVSGTTGGLQKGTQAMMFLSTGSGAAGEAIAVDLLLDFSGRNAGTLSFDWAAIDNGSGTRPTSLRVYTSTDGSVFTELTSAQVLEKVSVNTGSIALITLPSSFNGSSSARIRFYNYAGTATGSGNRDKMQIDNVSVTSTSTSLAAPTLTAASSPTVDAGFDVVFTDNAASQAWVSAAGTAITVGGTTLTAGYAISNGKITFTPSASIPVGLLQSSGVNKAIVITKSGYTNATVSQTINAGAATKLVMKTQPTAPSTNGAALATQPEVYIQDQYSNATTSTASVTASVGAGAWTLGGTASVAAVSGTTTFTGLTATSAAEVTGATIGFASAGLTGTTSGTFNIAAPPAQIDWANLQWPASGNINLGGTFNAYAQVYEPGITNAVGQGAGIQVWIGYNATNTNPNTWTNWVAATYSSDQSNNDEYVANIGAAIATSGTYYYATRVQLGSALYVYGGYNSGFWDGTTNVSGALTVNPAPTLDWVNLQSPASGNITTAQTFDVYSQVFESGLTEAAGQGAGVNAWIGYSTSNTNPNTWTDWVSASFNVQSGNNDEYKATLSGLPAGTYYYASRFKYGLADYVYGGFSSGFWDGTTNVNGTLIVTTPEPTAHVTSFSVSTVSPTYSSVQLTWTDAVGAASYLIKGSAVSYESITAPVDGTAEADAGLVKNIASGVGTYTFTALTAETPYYFKIFPNNGTGTAINFKTDGSVPQATATTTVAPTLLLNEDFNYTVGDLLTAHGWTAHSGTGGIAVATNSISYSGYLSSGVGNEVSISTTPSEDDNKTFTGQTSGTVYISFLVNVSATSTTGDYFFLVGQSTIGTTFRGRIYVKKDALGNLAFGIAQSTTPVNYTSLNYALNTTYLIVLKYNFVSGTTNDLASIYINPILNASEPSTGWLSNTDVSGTDLTELGTVALRQAGNVAAKLDGIRVSKNWTDIVGELPTFSGTGEWSEAARWNLGTAPGTTQSVVINGTASINSNVEIAGLTINSGKSLTVNAGKQLTVSGSLANNGTLNLLSTVDGTSTLTASSTSGTGTAIVSQYLADARNWYISSPVTAAEAPSGFTYYQRDEAGASWVSQPFVATNTFKRGKGYIALPNSAGATLTFSGKLNMSDTIVALTWSGATSKGFNLIGNPYPSHLTWTKTFVDANTSLIEPSIYYRTNSGTANNNHLWTNPTYNASSGASVAGATGIIPPMQAVWVRAVAAGNLTLDNTKLTRSHQGSNPLKSPAIAESQNLRLVVSDGKSSDEMLVYFNPNALDTYDAYDSPKMTNANAAIPEIYTTVGGEQLVINGLNSAVIANRELPLGFTTGQSNNFTIKATEISNFDADTRVILKDNLLKSEYELNVGNAYSFSSDVVNTSSRFSILFRSATGPNALYDNNFGLLYIGKNANNQITINGVGAKDGMVTVCNAVGQKLISTALTGSSLVIDKPFSTGVYLVTVNVGNAKVTKKVIIKAP